MKKIISTLLSIIMVLSLIPFSAASSETETVLPGVEINNDTTRWGDNVAHVSYDEIRNYDDTANVIIRQDVSKTQAVALDAAGEGVIFRGWVATTKNISGFSYSINGGSQATDAAFKSATEQAVVDAAKYLGGTDCSRFSVKVPLNAGTQLVRVFVDYEDGTSDMFWACEATVGEATDYTDAAAGTTPDSSETSDDDSTTGTIPDSSEASSDDSATGTTPDSSDTSDDKNTTANLEIDIPSYSEAVNFTPAGYTGKVFQMTYYGQTVNLGKIDLTKYSKVIVSYGAYSDATFDGKDYVALASAAVQTDDGSAVENVKIYAKCILESCTTGWFAGQRTAEAAINVTDFTAGSDVILAINIDKGSDGHADGAVIDKITLVADASDTGIFGKCGENATYTLTSDGTLTISGTGEITGANFSSKDIKTVIINSGITSIGNYAFSGCSNLTNITIPDSVTNIGEGAFNECNEDLTISCYEGSFAEMYATEKGIALWAVYGNCGNNATYGLTPNGVLTITGTGKITGANFLSKDIKTVIINSGITSIGSHVFSWCSKLTSITIPDSVTSIGDYAFLECTNLTNITIPDSVTSIGSKAFYNCSNLTSITIPNSVTSIGDYTFYYCSNLMNITIPDSVTSIGNYAFSGCSNLTNITISDSVTSIGNYAFSGCSNLTSVTIPDGVESIGYGTFSGCSNLTNITIPDSVTSIGNDAFYNCSNLTSVTIPDGVESIGYGTFSGCSSLTSVTIPNGVKSIGGWAFADCKNLTNITIPDSVTSIGNYAFSGCSNLNYTTYDNGKYLGNESNPYHAFIETTSSNIASCEIHKNTRIIAGSAFYNCSNLTSITIPESVTSIDDYTFYGCNNLTSIKIPDSVTSIGDSAFYKCNEGLTISCNNGSYAETYASDNGFLAITTGKCGNNATYTLNSNGVLVISGTGEVMSGESYVDNFWDPHSCFKDSNNIKTVIINSGITGIGKYAFAQCSNLTSVTIGNSVTSIGNYAFYGCSNLTNITIPECVTSIGNYAFNCCSNLNYTTYDNGKYLGNEDNPYVVLMDTTSSDITSCEIHENTKVIADSAFSGCSELTNITIPDSVTSIGDMAFFSCDNLTSVTIGNSVTCIGKEAFYYCSNLTSISIPDSVTSVDYSAFISCKNLNYATYDNGKYLGNEDNPYVILMDTTSSDITSCVIYNKTKVIYYKAFYDCSSLTSITIPDSVTSICDDAFYDCSSLTSITIPDSVTSIGDSAFYGCSSLASATIGNSVTSIGYSAFSWCSSLTSITIPDSVTSIGNCAFVGCDALTSINVSKDNECYKSIDGNLYSKDEKTLIEYASGKKDISFAISDSVTSIGDYAFYGRRSLTSITIPTSVTSIGSSAFMGCSNLTSITIPNSVTKIKSRTFTYCNSMTSVTIPNSVTSISTDAFVGCSSLTNINVSKDNECYKSIDGNLYSKDGKTLIQYAIGKANTSFSIPNGVTSISSSAFYYCSNLTSITIPDSVTSIGDSAFCLCGNLSKVIMPSSITSIGYKAFGYCDDDLAIVCERDSYAESYATNNGIDVEYINVPKALGGQIKITSPAGLRLGFSTENFNKTPTKLQIMVKKEDGEWKTVDVVKFYNEEKTIFTVCITNIPDSAKDVKFTAKAVATFADGTVRESDEITRSYNEVLQNLENAEK